MAVPKGIRTRPTPDWFTYYLSQVGFGNPPGGLASREFQAISIQNNSTLGAFLYIWGLSVIVSDADFAQFSFQATPPGLPQLAGSRVNPSIAAPPGRLFYDHNGPTPYTFAVQGTLPSFVAGPGAYNYPLLVIPPGQSLVLFTPVESDEFQLSCWYIPMLDMNGRRPV